MNGIMNTYILNTCTTTTLNNALVEEFPDGTMIHADGFNMTIPDIDVAAVEHTEDEDKYWLKSKLKIVIKWD